MIFDEICKNMYFKVDFVLDEMAYKIKLDDVERNVSEIIDYLQRNRGIIDFPKLIELYEYDSKFTTLYFYGDDDETWASCKIYDEDDDEHWLYDIKLKYNDSFNGLMSKYCSL